MNVMLMLKMLEVNGYENPYFTHFDEILAICKEYDVSLSLGPCYRPASVCDCKVNDELILLELERMSILCKKAIENGVGMLTSLLTEFGIDLGEHHNFTFAFKSGFAPSDFFTLSFNQIIEKFTHRFL